jgi:hypothetical protein
VTEISDEALSSWPAGLPIFGQLVGISFPQQGDWAWVKVAAENRRSALRLAKEGWRAWCAASEKLARAPERARPPDLTVSFSSRSVLLFRRVEAISLDDPPLLRDFGADGFVSRRFTFIVDLLASVPLSVAVLIASRPYSLADPLHRIRTQNSDENLRWKPLVQHERV